MDGRLRTLLTCGILVGIVPAGTASVRYVSARDVILSFQTANDTEVERVHVWVSTDEGESWGLSECPRIAATAVRFAAPSDGKYCLFMVLENVAGRSTQPPAEGATPHAVVIVDTTVPTLQIHSAEAVRQPGQRPLLHLKTSLIEENIGDSGIRVFYRTDDGEPWADGGPVPAGDGLISWTVPPNAGPEIDIRLVVTDRAGNRASEEVGGVKTPPADADEHSPDAPRSPARLTIAPVATPVLKPVPQVTLRDEAPPATATPTAQPTRHTDYLHLRALAERYSAGGRHTLAAARLKDALELAPGDADLLTDLGSALYRGRHYEETRGRFQSALDAHPDHLGALEGLALVAATQGRYSQAREYLKHLLRLTPQSGRLWLHYGDIRHKLGHRPEAIDAWDRVLKTPRVDEEIRGKARERLKYFRPVEN